jgi:hypothetical protein
MKASGQLDAAATLLLGEAAPDIHCMGYCVDPRTGGYGVEKNLLPRQESNPYSLAV